MEKNTEYRGKVCGLGTEGEGIIKCGDATVFVPYCLPDEEVVFKAVKVIGNVAYGKLTEVDSVSPERATPACPVFEKCGGCQLQHMTYAAQLDFKQNAVKNALKKLAGLDVNVQSTVPSEKQLRYRNKLVLPVSSDGENNLLGFYAERSHRIVPVYDCPIQAEWIKDIMTALRAFMTKSGEGGYNEQTKKGVIRHIVVRELQKKFVITLVVTKVIDARILCEELDKYFADYTLLLNVNDKNTNVIFSNEWHICRGEGEFCAVDDGVVLKAGARTFLQVNDGMRQKLYDAVCAAAADKNATALDLYSGGGLLTAMLAKKCKAAYGVEVVKEASECANEITRLNGLQGKMINVCGKVEDELPKILERIEGKTVAVCDPPRKGMERQVISALLSAAPEKIVLVSCNPATLARDLGYLTGSLTQTENGLQKTADYNLSSSPYKIESVTPFDMFPQTRHVETVVVLKKK